MRAAVVVLVLFGEASARARGRNRTLARWKLGRWAEEHAPPSEYERLQASKLEEERSMIEKIDALRVEPELTRRFATRLADVIASPVLCVGARLGGEVRAMMRVRPGLLAIGVDFAPGPRNPLVVWGDAHALRFNNDSFATVYSNILDHILDHEAFLSEAERVLAPNGTLILDVDQNAPDRWAVHDLREQLGAIEASARRRFGEPLRRMTIDDEKDRGKICLVWHLARAQLRKA